MIISVTPDVYVTFAKGGLNEDHILILPVKHAPSYASCPVEIQVVIDMFVSAIREMYARDHKDIIVWERWIPMKMTQANHMQIQIVAIPETLGASNSLLVLEQLTEKCLGCEPILKIDLAQDIADKVKGDAQMPYVYFELPGDNTEKGRMIDRYLIKAPGRRLPLTFAREVGATLLDLPDKVDWRTCQLDPDEEQSVAMILRQKFKPFVPKL